ncbi:MAG: DNA repair protein RecN [Acidimicrobiales bacterium]
MLAELRVLQLGVIEDLTLEFGAGMTALSGETGAGKTLLVEALQLILGQRAESGLVRAGASEATVEARFFDGAGDEIVISRSVPVEGRSRCWINGRMVTLSALSEVAATLADIHGQGDHQALLHTAAQRRALDEFGAIDPTAVDQLRQRVGAIRRRLAELGGDEHERARDHDMLEHQINEIEGARLADDPDEDANLLAEEERLGDLAALRERAGLALSALAADGGGALDRLGAAAAALDGPVSLGELDGRVRGAQSEVSDIATELRTVVETWDDDPERLADVQARRRLLSDLYRKYGGDRAATVAFLAEVTERLDRLGRAETEAAALGAELSSVGAELRAAEAALLAARTEAAPRLGAAIEERLGDLAMAGARFEVEVEPSGAGETVTFLLGANAGEGLRPLARAASGGELARTMLALRLVAPGGPPTMVFDEVDAGVGGTAALALAEALREVGGQRQVLVVTHLAQVAAFAERQVSVRKEEAAGRVSTSAEAVSGADRVSEVSRMLSGQPDSKRAQAHAEELLGLGRRRGAVVAG